MQDLPLLILDALAERGNAVVVIEKPWNGEQALIHSTNVPFSRMIGQPAGRLDGGPVGSLQNFVKSADDWSAFIMALRDRKPLDLDMRLQAGGREAWLGFGLTFKTDLPDIDYGIMLGRDVTAARKRSSQETASQRLLAAMFTRISVPVMLVQGDGLIVMSNPAYHRTIGYSADELVGRNVREFTPPEYYQAAQAARTEYLLSGAYELDMETITKSGKRLWVRMRSEVLPEAQDQRLRVITLIPRTVSKTLSIEPLDAGIVEHEPAIPPPRSVGQLQTISLAAIKAAAAKDWPRVASRAMSLAEEIIKPRIGKADILSRAGDESFIIWFDGVSEQMNDLLLHSLVQEVRTVFLAEFGEEMSGYVSGVVVGEDDPPANPPDDFAPRTASTALLDRLRGKRQRSLLSMKALLQEMSGLPVGEVEVVTDRDGRIRPLVIVDFPVPLRHRFSSLSTSMEQASEQGADIDLLRLRLAVRALRESHRGKSVLVPVSWQALTSLERRWSIDECLGQIDLPLRQNLILAVSGVPSLPSDTRWRKMVDPFRRQFGNVGLIVKLARDESASAQEAMINGWPLTLLIIDAEEPGSATSERYFDLITNARKRQIGILVRLPADGSVADWRELGATMFTGAR